MASLHASETMPFLSLITDITPKGPSVRRAHTRRFAGILPEIHSSELLCRLAIELGNLAMSPLQVKRTPSGKNPSGLYECADCMEYAAKYSYSHGSWKLYQTEHSNRCSRGPSKRLLGQRESSIHSRTIKLILDIIVLRDKFNLCFNRQHYQELIEHIYPQVWAQISSTRMLTRALTSYRENFVPIGNLPEFARFISINRLGEMQVNHAENVYQSTIYSCTPARPLLERVNPVFRLDFTHIYGRARGVLGTAVIKLGGYIILPVVVVHVPTNENLLAWKMLLTAVVAFARSTSNPPARVHICTDGFKGLGAAIERDFPEVVHFRCIHHLADSAQLLLKGKSISGHLWIASRQPNFKHFVKCFEVAWEVNPKICNLLCPVLARYFSVQRSAVVHPSTTESDPTTSSEPQIPERDTPLQDDENRPFVVPAPPHLPGIRRRCRESEAADLAGDSLSTSSSSSFASISSWSSSTSTSSSSSVSSSSNSPSPSPSDFSTHPASSSLDPGPPSSSSSSPASSCPSSPASFSSSSSFSFGDEMSNDVPTSFKHIAKGMPFKWAAWQYVAADALCFGDSSTNCVESWHSMIRQARIHLPLGVFVTTITLKILSILKKLPKRLSNEMGPASAGRLLRPKVWDPLAEKVKLQSPNVNLVKVTPVGGGASEIHYSNVFEGESSLNLTERRCEPCQLWQATGLPCCHVRAAIYNRFARLEDTIHPALNLKYLAEDIHGILTTLPNVLFIPSRSEHIPILNPSPQTRPSGRPGISRGKSRKEKAKIRRRK